MASAPADGAPRHRGSWASGRQARPARRNAMKRYRLIEARPAPEGRDAGTGPTGA
jgi:hypothetical protein